MSLIILVSSAAVLVFFARSTWTRIVSADLACALHGFRLVVDALDALLNFAVLASFHGDFHKGNRRVATNVVDHFVKHFKAFFLIFLHGIVLTVSAKSDTFPETRHCVDMIHPLAVDVS